MENQSQIRVMIVDDHHIVRSSLRLLLERHGHVVVAEAASAEEAVILAPKTRPQVVMMDLEMPGCDGLTAAGVTGYLLKSDAPEELISAVRAVNAGKRYLSPSITPLLLLHISDPRRSRTMGAALTPREREVLRLVGQGATSKEIAARLNISPKTAQVHRENLKQKLNLRTTADLVRYAIQQKIVKL